MCEFDIRLQHFSPLSGRVDSAPEDHQRVIEEIASAAAALDLRVHGVIESPLLGPQGNREFLMHLTLGSGS